MEFFYYIIFALLFSATRHALPLTEDSKTILKPQDLVFQPVYIIEYSELEPQPSEKRVQKRQADYLNDESAPFSDEDDTDVSETRRYRYYPYFRIRKTYTSHSNHPGYPLSNYADPYDPYDRFPTVA